MAYRYVRTSVAAILIMFVAITTPMAQVGHSTSIYISGGINQAAGTLGDFVKTGYGGSVGLGWAPPSISNGQIEFVVRGSFDYLPTSIIDGGPDLTIISGGLEMKLNQGRDRESNFYFLAGLGFSYTEWGSYDKSGTNFDKTKEYNPYLAPGMGIEYSQQKFSPFVELRLMVYTGDVVNEMYFVRAIGGIKL